MAEQAYAYVTLIPVAKGFQRRVADELSGAAPAAASAGRKSGQAFGNAVKAGIAVGSAAAATAVAGLGATLSAGFGRLQSLEEAESLLIGTGNSAEQVEAIMQNALASVKGTAFGLGDAARLAAGAVAAGVKPGQELERTLKAVGDTAAVAGVPLADIGAIINGVVTTNKAYTGELNQLADRGIPIYQYLADQVGVTAEAISEMASAGEISSEMLVTALQDNLGGAALEMGGTVAGSFANTQAAIGRVGANLLGPIFGRFAEFFNAVIEGLGPVEEKSKALGDSIGEFLNPKIDTLVELARNLSVPIQSVSIFMGNLQSSVGGVAGFFAPLVQSFGTLLSALPVLVPFVQELSEFFAQLALTVMPVLVDILSRFVSEVLPMLVTAMADLGPKVLDVVASLADAFLPILLTLAEAVIPVLTSVLSFLIPVVQFFADVLSGGNAGLAKLIAFGAIAVKGLLLMSGAFTAVTTKLALFRVATLRNVVMLRKKIGAMSALVTRMGVYTATILRNIVAATAQGVALAAAKAATVAQTIATTAAAAAQRIKNFVLSMSPLGRIIALITIVVGALVLFFTKTELGQKIWAAFTDFFLAAVSAIADFFRYVFTEWLPGVWSGFVDGITGAWDTFKGYFFAALEGIGDFFKGIINGWIGLFESFINFAIGGVNGLIDALNRIQVNIPATPFSDAFTLGVNIPRVSKVNLPRLAEGGFVDSPTMALIGEAGPEVVVPLDRFESMMGMDNGGGAINYYAAPNKSFDAEQELLLAMRRARLAA